MAPLRSFLTADVPKLVTELSTDERIRLLSAPNWWETTAIPSKSVPSIRMSDGPNGVRGTSHFNSTPAQCIPCATSLAATFDPDLVHQVGKFLAEEAKLKGATLLLAPTCNIQRSPLGGRSFESFSEDPQLSGALAAAYVNGLQQNGVGATIKHFVANEQEFDRTSQDSVVSPRALREIYLYPFMIAQRDAKPFAYMTGYNRMNGTHCSEHKWLLTDLLRKEWRFDGLVMSDWFGTYGTDLPINAGLDLEMPGPTKWRTPLLVNYLLGCKKIHPETIAERAQTVLNLVQKVAKLSPDVVYGDGKERTRDDPKVRAFCRTLAARGMVLLKNRGEVLPLSKDKALKIAVIGPNAKARVISGGGSAALKPSYVISPWEGLKATISDNCKLQYELGCYAHKFMPTLENNLRTAKGEPGWVCEFYAHDKDGRPTVELDKIVLNDTRIKLNDFLPEGLGEEWTLLCRGALTVDVTGPFEFGLTVAGRAKLFVDGKLLIDNWTKQRPGEFFYGQGTAEEHGTLNLTAGKPVQILVEYTNTRPPTSGETSKAQPALMRGVRLGGCPKVDPEVAMKAAVDLAASSDVAIIVAGLNSDWESEGFDRPSLALPGRQDELITRVTKANSKTIVCIQAGSAMSMPWLGQAAAVIQAWYSGNEVGNALADVLFGAINPSGKLPITFPKREKDIAAHLNFGGENNQVHYREDLYVGYKHFQARGIEPLFSFGYGLSYTRFKLGDMKVTCSKGMDAQSFKVTVNLEVANLGNRDGSEVVQLYVTYPNAQAQHPELQLRAFRRAHDVRAGKTTRVTLELDKYAVSYWHEPSQRWRAEQGEYTIRVGTSSRDLPLHGSFKITSSFDWYGL